MNILFVCSKNKWRSRTAETIFKDRWNVKSAGTKKGAVVRITPKLIEWSTIIFVMENKHRAQLMEKYRSLLNTKELIVLDIPDEYTYMDQELIRYFEEVIPSYL